MHTITIYSDATKEPSRGTDYTFPGEWGEVDASQLVTIAKVLSTTTEQAILRPMLLQKLACIPEHHMAVITAQDVLQAVPERLNPDDPFDQRTKIAWKLLHVLDWCFEHPVYRTSLLPVLEHKGRTWTGPADRLENFTINRYAYCEQLFRAMSTVQDEAIMDQLLAAIYQPEGQPWDNTRIEEHAATMRTVDPATKLSAVLNYRALRGFLPLMFPRPFDGSGELPMDSGAFGIIYEVAASGVFGNIDAVEQQPLLRVLAYMDHQIQSDQRHVPLINTATT